MIYFEAYTPYLTTLEKQAKYYKPCRDESITSLLKNICVISNSRFDYNSIAKTYEEYERFGNTSPIEEYGVSFNGKTRLFTVEADKQYSMILLLREFTNKEELNYDLS